MALTYTQDHNWWVQRVNKELMASSRFNMYNTRSTFYSGTKNSGFLRTKDKSFNRPLTSKSVASLSQKSLKRGQDPNFEDKEIKITEDEAKVGAGLNKAPALENDENPSIAMGAKSSRPSTNQFSIRSGKIRPSTGLKQEKISNHEKAQDEVGSVASNSINFSTKSIKSDQDAETLKNYIKELEKLLRFEKIKRIQTEESLKKLVSKPSSKSIQRFY